MVVTGRTFVRWIIRKSYSNVARYIAAWFRSDRWSLRFSNRQEAKIINPASACRCSVLVGERLQDVTCS